jgi:hypothetical protein
VLEAEVPVERPGVVFLDHEFRTLAAATTPGAISHRLRGPPGVPFRAVLPQRGIALLFRTASAARGRDAICSQQPRIVPRRSGGGTTSPVRPVQLEREEVTLLLDASQDVGGGEFQCRRLARFQAVPDLLPRHRGRHRRAGPRPYGVDPDRRLGRMVLGPVDEHLLAPQGLPHVRGDQFGVLVLQGRRNVVCIGP